MNDKVFIDTNIWIYLYSDNKKSQLSKKLIETNFEKIVLSTQILNEFFNVIAIKYKIKSKEDTKNIIEDLIDDFPISEVNSKVILKAIDISIKYQYSFFDSLMITSTIIENCSVLYSEDLHHNQIIENTLTITNPFIK